MEKLTEQEAIHGSRVRQARELSRITQTQIADAAGVNQSTIARIESDRMPFPPPDLLTSIAEQTGVTVEGSSPGSRWSPFQKAPSFTAPKPSPQSASSDKPSSTPHCW